MMARRRSFADEIDGERVEMRGTTTNPLNRARRRCVHTE
jgi:hypothetical protein